MIGIYKILNKETGKMYIGQSNDITRRIGEHLTKGKASRIPLDAEIEIKGKEYYDWEVVELCSLDQLNEKETYWIKYFNTVENGYNENYGGQTNLIGSNNPNAKLSEEDIVVIRKAYADHKRQREIYEFFKDKVSFGHFQNVWQGKVWNHIMPEVFTEENKKYYIYENSIGANGASAKLTDEEVIELRNQYVTKSAKELYENYKNRVTYQTFQQILWGRTYNHLPVYKKKERIWINK